MTRVSLDAVAVSTLRERAIQAIEFHSGDENPTVRGNAIEAATLTPARSASIIRRGLRDGSPAVRAIAALAVGRSRLAELVDDVRPLLTDSSEQSAFVQSAAIFAMARCGVETDLSPLAGWLLRSPRAALRSHVAFILGELGDNSAVPMLYQASRESLPSAGSIEVRLMELQIAEALVKLGETDQLKVMRAALYPSQPDDLEATALAVQILGQVRDRAAIDQLIYLVERRDDRGGRMPAEVRLAVASSLARLGLPQGDFVADEYFDNPGAPIRAQASHVYGETGKPANLSILAGLLDDRDHGVRVAAAAAILKITGPASR